MSFTTTSTRRRAAPWLCNRQTLLLAALIIVFREVFEAGLIIGIVLAVTGSVPHRNRWIVGGVMAGALAACVVAAFAGALSQLFAGMGQELFNAAILSVAVMMLTWHNVWMARHGREIAGEMRAVGQAVAFLESANWLTSLDTVVWDSGWLLSDKSIAGRAMHTLIGYTDQPTEMQLLVYVAVLLATIALMRLTGSQHGDRAVATG